MKKHLFILLLASLSILQVFAQKAMTFPGSTATYAWAADNAALNLASGQSMTISAWVNTTSTSELFFLAKRTSTGIGYEVWMTSGGYLATNCTHTNNSSSGLPAGTKHKINDGKWHHIAFVIDNTNGYFLYVDGKLEVSKAIVSTTGVTNTEKLYIGIRNTKNGLISPVNGSLDELHYYNKALAESEIQNDMLTLASSKPSGMVAAWDFEDYVAGVSTTADVIGTNASTIVGLPTSTNITLTPQTITMNGPINVGLSQADFSPATCTSVLPIQYSSSEPSVASIVNGKIHIVTKGSCTITSSQAGNSFYAAASPVSQVLNIGISSVSFNIPFTNNAVIQRDNPIVVTGKAEPNDSLTVNLDGAINKIKVDANGNWATTFAAKSAKSTPFTLSAGGITTAPTTLTNLLCGDVWVASGQSNMLFPIAACSAYTGMTNSLTDASTQVSNASNYPNIRFIQPVDVWQQFISPQTTVNALNSGWSVCSSTTATYYSAVAYFFARNLLTDQNIPSGIIEAAIGGTNIESWTSLSTLQNTPEYASAYTTATTVALPTSTDVSTTDGAFRKNFPTANYNGMIAPYTHSPVKGIIWYQGENNLVNDGAKNTTYGNKVKATINGWRNAWGNSNLPVIYVQIANFQYSVNFASQTGSSRETLPLFTEQQDKAMELNNVWGIPTSDISNYGNIHPSDKSTVGSRLANVALKFLYGKTGIQPLAAFKDSIKAEGSSVRVVFKNNSGFHMSSGTTYTGFQIAGLDKVFKKAHAVLSGNDILLSDSTSSITRPIYVRFGWDENGTTNLFNDSNSPALRFRDSLSYTMQAIDTLQMAIDNAKARKALMPMGTEPGQYMPAVVSAFNQKITDATAIANNTSLTNAAYHIAADSMNAQTLYYKAAINYPKVSSAETEYWYTFSTPLRGSYNVAYQGDNTDLKGETYTAGTDKLLWKLTKNIDGTFNIISKVSGCYIGPASAVNSALKAQTKTPTSGGWTFIPTYNSNYFAVVSGTAQFNQTNSGLSYKIYNWGGGSNLTDAGCQYLIKTENTNQNQQKIACVGNSITFGYTLASPSTQSYPAQLQNMLGTYDWTVSNYGVSSRTMLKKGNLPYWNETAYTNALASNPNYVIIELGTNDAKTTNWNTWGYQFSDDYKAMIKSFRDLASKPEMWIALQPPGENTGWTIYNSYIKDSVNTRIKQVAIELGTGLIDLYTAFNGDFSNSTYFYTDGVHPTMAGAGVIAQKVYDLLTTPKPTLIYSNGKITCSTTSYDSQWYRNDTILSMAEGGKNLEFIPAKIGVYKLSIQPAATSESRIVSSALNITSLNTGVKSPTGSNDFKVSVSKSGNPTLKVIFNQDFQQYKKIRVFNENGKILHTQPIRQNIETVTLNSNSNKVLIVEIIGNTGSKSNKVLLKQ